MSNIKSFPPSNNTSDQQSIAFGDAVINLFKALPKSEQQRILPAMSAILDPIPAPRAGEILGTVTRFLPRKSDWSVADIKGEVAVAGVRATSKEIYNALGYLVRKGHVKRVGYGRYLVEGTLLVTSEDFGGKPGGHEDD